MPEQRREPPPPLDPPMVPVVLAGTAAWVVAGLVVLVAGGPSEWLRICLAGLLAGLVLLALMVVRDRRRLQAEPETQRRRVSRGRTARKDRRSPPSRAPGSP